MIHGINLHGVRDAALRSETPTRSPRSGEFAHVLRQALDPPRNVRFSAHAEQRLASRQIALSGTDHARLASALDDAAGRGARETLILLDRLALVASVPNRTVITVLTPESGENTVFTNIDSAVVTARESSNQKQEQTGLDPVWGSPQSADRLTRQQGDYNHG